MLMLSMPLFHGVHHAHHGHTNDPERDPDLIVAKGPAWSRPIAFLAVVPTYHWYFYRSKLWRTPSGLREAVVTDAVILGFIVISIAAGFGPWLVTLWLAPLVLTSLWLSFSFDYLPHYPHSTQGRYFDTRVYPGRIANVLFLGQNYHLIHHLWTTIPWYRYQAVYAAIEPELHERGCGIGWASRAVRPPSHGLAPRDTLEPDKMGKARCPEEAGRQRILVRRSAGIQ
jgi:beta-carotene hydroxylase